MITPAQLADCILAIDPGSFRSAWVLYDRDRETVLGHGISPNPNMLALLGDGLETAALGDWYYIPLPRNAIIEWVQPRGMLGSAELFETLWWAGRFTEAIQRPGIGGAAVVARLTRYAVKKHVCGTGAAKDQNVRAALVDRFGGVAGKSAAIGLKANPGPLYGIREDEWAALAVAVTYADDPSLVFRPG